MKLRIPISLLLCTFLFVSCKQEKKEIITEQPQAETTSKPPKKVLSPHTSAMAMIGGRTYPHRLFITGC